jgi:hypothetical protein
VCAEFLVEDKQQKKQKHHIFQHGSIDALGLLLRFGQGGEASID